MQSLKNKIAVVTGGTTGIGYATAKEFHNEGATVIITGRRKPDLNKVANELKVTGIAADQLNLGEIDALVEDVVVAFKKIDILFLNAGIAAFSPLATATEDHYDSIMDLNVKGCFFTIQKFLPLMNEGGSIIFNASVNAQLGAPDSTVYAASKAAILSISRVLARELSEKKIRVNAISPGPVATPLYDKLGLSKDEMQGFGELLSKRILLNRFAQPSEVAKVARFLASEDASFITGSEIVVDGGLTVNALMY